MATLRKKDAGCHEKARRLTAAGHARQREGRQAATEAARTASAPPTDVKIGIPLMLWRVGRPVPPGTHRENLAEVLAQALVQRGLAVAV